MLSRTAEIDRRLFRESFDSLRERGPGRRALRAVRCNQDGSRGARGWALDSWYQVPQACNAVAMPEIKAPEVITTPGALAFQALVPA